MRRITIICCLLAWVLPVSAFEAPRDLSAAQLDSLYRADSLAAVDSALARNKRPSTIDISRYAMQKRWQPVDEQAPMGLRWLLNDAYVYAYGTYLMQFVSQYGPGPCGQIGYGKWFSDKQGLHHYHGMRLGIGAGWSYDNYNASHVSAIEVRASYLFDASAFASGYHPRRIFSFVPQIGAGMSFVDGEHRKFEHVAFSLHMGLDWVVHSFPGVSVVLEPLFELHTDPRRLPRQNVWKKFVPAFRGNVGVHVQLDRKYWRALSDPGKDWRVSLAAGPAFQAAPNIRSAKDFFQVMGYSIALGLARSYTDWFDWRFQMGLTTHSWYENRLDLSSRDVRSATSVYLRVDAMFDIPAMFLPPASDWRRFRFLVLAGPELGLLHKDGVENLKVFPYMGLSGGLQFRWEPWRKVAIFVEPRISAIPYTTKSNKLQNAYSNYSDLVTALYFGVEYRFGH